jgi:hypothetical protein
MYQVTATIKIPGQTLKGKLEGIFIPKNETAERKVIVEKCTEAVKNRLSSKVERDSVEIKISYKKLPGDFWASEDK